MPYPLQFLRLVAIGSLYNAETFSYSMSLIHNGGPTPNAPEEVPPAIVAAFETFHETPQLFAQAARLTTLKLNLIGTDGRYVNPETVLHEYDPVISGASGANTPPQVAYTVSLRTGRARGRAHAGRFYLPTPGPAINVNGILDDLNRSVISTATMDLIESINAALVPWRVGVVSDLGAGAQFPVTALRFGRVLDTIRSRRTSIPEDYAEIELPV